MTTPIVLHRPEGARDVFLHTFDGNVRDARSFAARADGNTHFMQLNDPIAMSDVSVVVATVANMMRSAPKP